MKKIGILLLILVLILASSGLMSKTANAIGIVINTGVVGSYPSVSARIGGSIIALLTGESSIDTDLNGDGDTDDCVIRYYDILTRTLINTGAVGYLPSVSGSYGGIIAFETFEGDIGEDLNGDGDTLDTIIRYKDTLLVSLVNTGVVGDDPSVSGGFIAFRRGGVIRYYDISTGMVKSTSAVGVSASVSGNIIAFNTPAGPLRRGEIMYYDIPTGSLVNTGAIGVSASAGGNIIAFTTFEYGIDTDLNGDGDTSDFVIRYVDIQAAPTTKALAALIEAYVAVGSIDDEGVGEALKMLLVQAQAKMNPHYKSAKRILSAFILLVEAQAGKSITIEAAQALIDSAQAIINSL